MKDVVSFDRRVRQALAAKDFISAMIKDFYKTAGEIILIPYEMISPDPYRKRKEIPEREITELCGSIEKNGLLNPLHVKAVDEECFVIVSGERRFQSCVRLGIREIPCILLQESDPECAVLAFLDNMTRRTVDPFEEAELLQTLIADHEISLQDVCERIGRPAEYVRKTLRLLELPEEIRDFARARGLEGEYAELLAEAPAAVRKQLMKRIGEEDLSLRQARAIVDRAANGQEKQGNVMIFKDLTVFKNTVEHAVETMRRCGLQACADKNETDDEIQYTVVISKNG